MCICMLQNEGAAKVASKYSTCFELRPVKVQNTGRESGGKACTKDLESSQLAPSLGNNKLLGTSASLLVTSALFVVTRSY